MSIDIHLKKLMQKSITRLDFRKSEDVVKRTTLRIRNSMQQKKNRKLKLRKISLQRKRNWMKKSLNIAKIKKCDVYIASSWIQSSLIKITNSKKKSITKHDNDHSSSRQRTYLNENNENEDVTAATIKSNWKKKSKTR